MNNQQKIVAIVALAIVLIAGIVFFNKGSLSQQDDGTYAGTGIQNEPLDVVTDFYGAWLEARKSTSTDPYASNLQNSEILAPILREKLSTSETAFRENGADPVLCREPLPDKFRMKIIHESDTETQILVMGKVEVSTVLSIATLKGVDGSWYIDDMTCNAGEEAPDLGEFNFDKEGYLLKDHVPPPYNSQQWHLVFEQEGVDGHVVPILLSETSVCINASTEGACDEGMLFEAAHIHLQGNMSEAGADVKRIEFLE